MHQSLTSAHGFMTDEGCTYPKIEAVLNEVLDKIKTSLIVCVVVVHGRSLIGFPHTREGRGKIESHSMLDGRRARLLANLEARHQQLQATAA